MAMYDWDENKNKWLKKKRGVGFEDVVSAIRKGNLLATVPHYNQVDYSYQKILYVEIDEYVYMIPYVPGEKDFLKTIYPSRKATKKYLGGNND